MSTLKTKINSDIVLSFLQTNFNKNIASLDPITGGELSQAFFFTSNNEDYVIRINTSLEHFEKDAYAFQHFSSPKLPIPKTIRLGKLDDTYFFSITKRAKGKIFSDFKGQELQNLLPNFVDTLDAIRTTDISNTVGYGDVSENGNGKYATWKKSILAIIDGDAFDWQKVFKETFFEKTVYDTACKRLVTLIDACPEERFLVHGDFGFNNLICNDGKVTGVFDWALVKYGDFLFDIAWLDFWQTEIDFKKIFYAHAEKLNISLPDYEERILCYQIYFGLGSLCFFAYSEQKASYDFAKDRLLTLIAKLK